MDNKMNLKFSGNENQPEGEMIPTGDVFKVGSIEFSGLTLPTFDLKEEKAKPVKEGVITLLPVIREAGDGSPREYDRLEYDPKLMLKMLEEGRHEELTDEIVRVFRFFAANTISSISKEDFEKLTVLTKLLLMIISDERYIIPDSRAPIPMFGCTLLSNLVEFTGFGTTDVFLKKVLDQPNNLIKVLTLYTMRNKINLDLGELFAANPQTVSVWWVYVLDQTRNCNSDFMYKRMLNLLTDEGALKHFSIAENNFQVYDTLTHPVFIASYLKPEFEPIIKRKVNAELKRIAIERTPHPNPDMKKMLVVSWVFRKKHAVYKAMAPLVRTLKGHYKLIYVSLDPSIKENSELLDRELFDEIWMFFQDDKFAPRQDTYRKIMSEDYGIVFLPDVGMNFNSIAFANTRLAPIQVSSYGHPVSTYASEIDYFIAGQEVETPNKPEQYFSERLVLIPGIASQPVLNEYKLSGVKAETDRFLISCSWGTIKVYYPMLEQLKTIIKRSKKEICFFFSGIHGHNFNLFTFRRDLANLLGEENINVVQILPHNDYMKCIEVCEFGIDAYPFGSFNRVVDTLVARKPLVCLEGERTYNRMASAIMKHLGLQELVATSYDDYVDKTLNLIHDDAYRTDLVERIQNMDLKGRLFNTGNEKYLRKAFDYMVENHERLQKEKSRKPIIIPRD